VFSSDLLLSGVRGGAAGRGTALRGEALRCGVRHCAATRKVEDSVPDCIIRIYNVYNLFALTQPPKVPRTGDMLWWIKEAGY
jgi:hypothetical protein